MESLPTSPAQQPYLSLCVISNNNKPNALPRLLDSVLKRPKGASADEVVVWWNGSGDRPTSLDDYDLPKGVTLRVIKGEWREDFGWARQESFEAARGVWRMYLDGDDVLAASGTTAVDRNLEAAHVEKAATGSHSTLQDYLRDLPPHVNALYLPYDYSEDDKGNTMQRLWRCRAVRWADGWAWHWAVHEDLKPIGGCSPSPVFNAGLVVLHDAAESGEARSRRNLKILQRVYAEEGDADQRVLYGIGVALLDLCQVEEGTGWLERALALKPPDEDAAIYHTILTTAYLQLLRFDEAQQHALAAVATYPDRPNGCLSMGEVCVAKREYARGRVWLERGLEMPHPAVYIYDMPAQRAGFYRAALADCLLNLGDVEGALKQAEAAGEKASHPYVTAILRLAKDASARHKRYEAMELLVQGALADRDAAAAKQLLDACPAQLEGSPQVRRMRVAAATLAAETEALTEEPTLETDPDRACAAAERIAGDFGQVTVTVPDAGRLGATPGGAARVYWNAERLYRYLSKRGRVESLTAIALGEVADPEPHLRAVYKLGDPPRVEAGASPAHVAIYAPHYVEPWGPHSINDRGIGGSEEAVVYLSAELSKLGYRVEVYGPLPMDQRPLHVHDGVAWRPLEMWDPDLPADHVIALRAPWIAAFQSSQRHVGQLWIWHHDHSYPDESFGPYLATRAKHLYVSHWQRSQLEAVGGKTQGKVIYNGVPPDQIAAARHAVQERGEPRDPYRCVWASMPTRRLDRLVRMWPAIRERWPQATLDVYYGIHTVAQLWRTQAPHIFGRMQTLQTEIDALKDHGLTWKDRVSQPALCEAFWTAGVMAYPSDFPEVYMIAAARAAACGCVPVVANTGSLAETCPTAPVEGPIDDEHWEETLPAFMDRLGAAFETTEQQRLVLAEETLTVRSWGKVAQRVVEAFTAAESDNERVLASEEPDTVAEPPYREPVMM